MDFNVKKLVREAGTAISRVVQLTEEKLGTSEKTELDSHFEHLAERSDSTKLWTEKIVRDVEAVLTPNPGNRVEDYLLQKIDKKPTRLSNLEYLGLDMIEAGNGFGPETSYGNALIKVGQCEQKLGNMEREFITAANQSLVEPLHKFLDGEMKAISREKSILESKRLDLDACKNRVRKARSMLGGPANAERDLRIAQAEFDRQAEITKLLLEGVSSSHASHLRCLIEFANVQANYYAQCSQRMKQLQKDLSGLSSTGESGNSHQHTHRSSSASASGSQVSSSKGKPVYNIQGVSEALLDGEEISLKFDDEVENDYVLAEKQQDH